VNVRCPDRHRGRTQPGNREIPGVDVTGSKDAKGGWRSCAAWLARGLSSVALVISGNHAGPTGERDRCVVLRGCLTAVLRALRRPVDYVGLVGGVPRGDLMRRRKVGIIRLG
jgi:hypothetical protein